MSQVKVSDLTGAALDYAVSKAEGHTPRYQRHFVTLDTLQYCVDWDTAEEYTPSTDWAQGGPIIERNRLQLTTSGVWVCSTPLPVVIDGCRKYVFQSGDTPLIAGMRCLVASKLGGIIEVPEELLK